MVSRKKQLRKKQWEELDLAKFKLLPSAKPPFFHGSTVRKAAQYFWNKKLRPAVLEQQENKCSICGWVPGKEEDIKRLHLHELENYDFQNKVCQLIEIKLICRDCHSLQHIGRTKSVLSKEQWENLMEHFIKVNGCSPDIDFDLVLAKSIKSEGHFEAQRKMTFEMTLEERMKLAKKTVRFTINPEIPLAEELKMHLMKRELLYAGSDMKEDKEND
ncbi:hypothetical protein IHV10_20045 [Fictibacillus sp. 5RED26]|uniref:hypothetical protein n=1 Tax=Fictibacillus sp. 5RED26 TaxID=2745876 RepID=UPI0018CDF65C|nr:hypothetical protein [Fictibacillus sp. 5RED26]MBH0158678.1 hypothetical protein [Fictibacillus sp. 5RED26]